MEHAVESPVQFDPMSSVYFQDPYATYRRLRDEAPVYWSEQYGFYALSRYDDVNRAHRDTVALSSTSTPGVPVAYSSREKLSFTW